MPPSTRMACPVTTRLRRSKKRRHFSEFLGPPIAPQRYLRLDLPADLFDRNSLGLRLNFI
jgi:hypothetical protein